MTTRRSFLATLTAVSLAPALARAATARKGMFSGRSRHVTTGWVEVTDSTVALQRDFSLDRAPDPVVGLGNNGEYDPSTFMGELKSKKVHQAIRSPQASMPRPITKSMFGAAPQMFLWASPRSVRILT